MRTMACVAAFALLCGCQTLGEERPAVELDQEATEVDFVVKESRTLSILAKLETAIADFYKTEGKVPRKLTDLVPKYLADIPTVELVGARHKDTSAVQYYPADIIRDGQIDGSRLKDSGKWGYAYNEKQVIVFVDCTHRNSKGVPWFQVRGIY
ncbi:MAG: hypothetical protein WC943_03030 [Elusimicrobiota bacterium]